MWSPPAHQPGQKTAGRCSRKGQQSTACGAQTCRFFRRRSDRKCQKQLQQPNHPVGESAKRGRKDATKGSSQPNVHETFIANVPLGDRMEIPHANSEKLMYPSPFSSNNTNTLSTKYEDLHPNARWKSLRNTYKHRCVRENAVGYLANLRRRNVLPVDELRSGAFVGLLDHTELVVQGLDLISRD